MDKGKTKMIVRDNLGIIGQQQDDGSIDFGDGCFKSCMANIAGLNYCSVMHFQEADGRIVRHPTDLKWSNPDLTSRDQLIPWLASCWFNGCTGFVFRALRNYQWRINKDLLIDPSIRWFMRRCSGDKNHSWLGEKFLRLNIWYAGKTDHELNQLVAICLVLVYIKELCASVPDWEKRLHDYWSGWRGQKEVADALILRIKKELEA